MSDEKGKVFGVRRGLREDFCFQDFHTLRWCTHVAVLRERNPCCQFQTCFLLTFFRSFSCVSSQLSSLCISWTAGGQFRKKKNYWGRFYFFFVHVSKVSLFMAYFYALTFGYCVCEKNALENWVEIVQNFYISLREKLWLWNKKIWIFFANILKNINFKRTFLNFF